MNMNDILKAIQDGEWAVDSYLGNVTPEKFIADIKELQKQSTEVKEFKEKIIKMIQEN